MQQDPLQAAQLLYHLTSQAGVGINVDGRAVSEDQQRGLVQLGRVGVQKANELAYRAAPAQKLAKLGSLAALRGVQEPGELRERLSTH